MSYKRDWFEVVRGVEVQIHATEWDHGPGMPWGPSAIDATNLDTGEPFELTEPEIEKFTIQASQAAYDDGPYLDE